VINVKLGKYMIVISKI